MVKKKNIVSLGADYDKKQVFCLMVKKIDRLDMTLLTVKLPIREEIYV